MRTAIAESVLALVRADPPLPGVRERFWLVQGIAPIEGSTFEEALDCVLIIPLGEESIALRRQIGRRAGTLVLMDVFVEDGVALYQAEQDISALFASVQLR
ncbi:hypothetical protein [Microbacterium sp. OR16]|uniref:hypothetical protein n=1 Tax=Microbacterium sp. OR16 TaxID=3095345 RepID=UPI0039B4E5CE